jgi:hypothetical protein
MIAIYNSDILASYGSGERMASPVNLDALFPRADFYIDSGGRDYDPSNTRDIKVGELLKTGLTFNNLRKPDFRRETSAWEPAKVADLVRSFVDGDLIPAVILWSSGGVMFIVDGAHRLSALTAWVNDDYGDGEISLKFYKGQITESQRRAAAKAKELIDSEIGTYQQFLSQYDKLDKIDDQLADRVRRLTRKGIEIQWVPTKDAAKAEASFFKMNEAAEMINDTEKMIIKARQKPNAISARAILRGGQSSSFWRRFSEEVAKEVATLGKEIHSILYTRQISFPLRSLDLPVGGSDYGAQALPLIFEFVNVANNIPVTDTKSRKASPATAMADDADGKATISFLKNTRRLVRSISGNHPSSLGPHPYIYFYNRGGYFQPTVFLGVVQWINELRSASKLHLFTKYRKELEEILADNKNFLSDTGHKFGGLNRSMPWVMRLLSTILEKLADGRDKDKILASLKRSKDFSFLFPRKTSGNGRRKVGAKMGRGVKSAVAGAALLPNVLRCAHCGGFLATDSMQTDHKLRRRDHGSSSFDNAQLMHPYCNSTDKQ